MRVLTGSMSSDFIYKLVRDPLSIQCRPSRNVGTTVHYIVVASITGIKFPACLLATGWKCAVSMGGARSQADARGASSAAADACAAAVDDSSAGICEFDGFERVAQNIDSPLYT